MLQIILLILAQSVDTYINENSSAPKRGFTNLFYFLEKLLYHCDRENQKRFNENKILTLYLGKFGNCHAISAYYEISSWHLPTFFLVAWSVTVLP